MSTAPVPAAPAQSHARPTSYVWLSADVLTGRIIEELPFVPSGPMSSVLGGYTSLSGSLILPAAPRGWEGATDPGRTMLVAVREDDGMPLWGGLVLSRGGGSDSSVELGLATLESYFDRRYVADAVHTTWASQIAFNLVYDTWNHEGIPFQWDWTNYYPIVTRTYRRDADQTVYSALTELMRSEAGPEWTIWYRWVGGDTTTIHNVLQIKPRIGVASSNPTAVFDLPGNVKTYRMGEDFTSGKGANHIEMFGDGEGDTRPQTTTPARAEDLLDAGWPRYEYRATRSGVKHPATLDGHAFEALAWMAAGARTYTVTADASTAPRLGRDWAIGDDVRLDVSWSPRHPDGFSIVGRAIGWEIDTGEGTVTPLLEEVQEGVVRGQVQ